MGNESLFKLRKESKHFFINLIEPFIQLVQLYASQNRCYQKKHTHKSYFYILFVWYCARVKLQFTSSALSVSFQDPRFEHFVVFLFSLLNISMIKYQVDLLHFMFFQRFFMVLVNYNNIILITYICVPAAQKQS